MGLSLPIIVRRPAAVMLVRADALPAAARRRLTGGAAPASARRLAEDAVAAGLRDEPGRSELRALAAELDGSVGAFHGLSDAGAHAVLRRAVAEGRLVAVPLPDSASSRAPDADEPLAAMASGLSAAGVQRRAPSPAPAAAGLAAGHASRPQTLPIAAPPGAGRGGAPVLPGGQSPTVARPAAPVPPARLNVGGMDLDDRFVEVLRRVPPFLPDKVRAEFEQMLTPEALGIMAATLAVWAVSHFAGVGFIVDILLLVAGAVFLGMAVFRAAGLILDALAATRDATSEADLDTAARLLAEAIAIIGVGTFMALLARVAGKVRPRRGGRATPGTASKPPPEPVPPPTGQTAPPKPAAPPGPVPTPPKQLSFKPSQLQKKYKHAPDFGCPPNYSPENASRFEAALRQHVAAPQTRTIPGEYGRGASPQQVLHHFDPSTGRNVMTDTQGNFISAWKLSADQQRHLLTTGRLGGG